MNQRRFAIYARSAPDLLCACLVTEAVACDRAVRRLRGIVVPSFAEVFAARSTARWSSAKLLRGIAVGEFDALMCHGLDRLPRMMGDFRNLWAPITDSTPPLHDAEGRTWDAPTLAAFDEAGAGTMHRAGGVRLGIAGSQS